MNEELGMIGKVRVNIETLQSCFTFISQFEVWKNLDDGLHELRKEEVRKSSEKAYEIIKLYEKLVHLHICNDSIDYNHNITPLIYLLAWYYTEEKKTTFHIQNEIYVVIEAMLVIIKPDMDHDTFFAIASFIIQNARDRDEAKKLYYLLEPYARVDHKPSSAPISSVISFNGLYSIVHSIGPIITIAKEEGEGK
jgi:hypothetical protein